MDVALAQIATQQRQVDIQMSKSFAPKVYHLKYKKYANFLPALRGHLPWVGGE
jgi:hypothetical protein